MRRAVPLLAVLAAASLAVLVAAQTAAPAELGEPVSVTATAPQAVQRGVAFPLTVDVAAEADALDVAAQPLRLRVRFAPECGGSFAGTEGPTALDRVLPAPSAGAAYEETVSVKTKLSSLGPETVCAFLEDNQERQFATDTEAEVAVVPPCRVAKRKLARLKRKLHHASSKRQHHHLKKRLRKARRLVKRACGGGAKASQAAVANLPAGVPQIKHLFVIVLENENGENTFGANPPAPYLGKTLREAGAYIPNYYGIGHLSLDNYIAMVSGQPPNPQTQSDCQFYTEMAPGTLRGDGVALGQGCVFPRGVRTVANQLESSGLSWRGYMQDMANSVAAGEPASCRHPAIGAPDPTQNARAADQYATRHNPFVYFHSIIDFPTCQQNDVDLGRLPADLASEDTTPNYAFITPDLCSDGHDATCANPALPAGYAGIEAFLREWVPRIQGSAAYRDQGAILVTFDEAASGAQSCCNEPTGPNTPNNGGVEQGSGGGKVGAVMLSPCIKPGTVTQTPYNHYSFLRWVEDNFGLPHLANAGANGLATFGADVFTRPGCDPEAAEAAQKAHAWTRLRVHPRKAAVGERRSFRFVLRSNLAACRRGALVRFAGHRARTNRRARALIRVRPHRSGRLAATARAPGCRRATTGVRVRR